MMLEIRFTAALLTAAAFLSLFMCSCSGSTEKESTSNVISLFTDLETDTPEPDVVAKSFRGSSFVICSLVHEDSDYPDNYIDNDEYIGEAVNDAVLTRNLNVENKFEIRIFRRNENADYVSRAVRSDTVDFDLVYDRGTTLAAYAVEGIFADLKEMDSLDLSAQYWAPSTQDSLTIAGKLLTATCDISMNRMTDTDLYVFNKGLFDEFEVQYPYGYVDNGDWTFDRFIETVQAIGADADNNGLWTSSDLYGTDRFDIETFILGAGLCKRLSVRNYEGALALNVYTKELVTLYNDYSSALKNSHVTPSYIDWSKNSGSVVREGLEGKEELIPFVEGHTAIQKMTMRDVAAITGLMEDRSIGVVPIPKYTASQKDYYHEIKPGAPMFAVPKRIKNEEKTCSILEYLSYESMKTVLPAFYKQTLHTGCMSDPEDRDEKMLAVVRNSGYYRSTALYADVILSPDGTPWDPCTVMLDEMLMTGDFSEVQKEYRESAQESLDDLCQRVTDTDDKNK